GRAPKGFAPIAIGLGLTLIHLIGIPITNTSVNPARSTGAAIFAGGWALSQLWLFWIAPLIGGFIGGGIYRALFGERVEISGEEAVRGPALYVPWALSHAFSPKGAAHSPITPRVHKNNQRVRNANIATSPCEIRTFQSPKS